MATLYVENVPDELYEALRALAKRRRTSIAAETLSVLRESIPTEDELKRRRRFLRTARQMSIRNTRSFGSFPSTEALQREDRER